LETCRETCRPVARPWGRVGQPAVPDRRVQHLCCRALRCRENARQDPAPPHRCRSRNSSSHAQGHRPPPTRPLIARDWGGVLLDQRNSPPDSDVIAFFAPQFSAVRKGDGHRPDSVIWSIAGRPAAQGRPRGQPPPTTPWHVRFNATQIWCQHVRLLRI